MAAAGPALAQKWTFAASAGATATYNKYFGPNQPSDGFTACLTASLGINGGEGGRLKVNGTLGASQFLCTGQSNNFAPAVNLAANLEVIEKFFFIDATANASTSFITPFGPQPANQTVESNNRYISQSYSVSPYIQGVIAPNITYSVRFDNVWTPSSSYGNSSVKAPTTYYNNLNAQMGSAVGNGGGWTLQYTRSSYDNGVDTGTYDHRDRTCHSFLRGGPAVDGVGPRRIPDHFLSGIDCKRRLAVTVVELRWSDLRCRSQLAANGSDLGQRVLGAPVLRLVLQLAGEPSAAECCAEREFHARPQQLSATRAGDSCGRHRCTVSGRCVHDPDSRPAQRAAAVALFLAQTGLPPTLASPLNFYAQSITLQQTATLVCRMGRCTQRGRVLAVQFVERSDLRHGLRLPPAFQFGVNNTQTGGSVNYSRRLSGLTNFGASATYSTTKPNNTQGSLNNVRTNNFNATASLNTQFSPKTNGSVGVSWFTFETPGVSNFGTQSTASVFASVNHNF